MAQIENNMWYFLKGKNDLMSFSSSMLYMLGCVNNILFCI